ncbi:MULTISPECIES: isoprenylcysteine carboxylmethyltransferase family protein [Paracoccaceae]|uniref:methyltransferase family protein n=1 Tax=Paracoccaceae TaxID=31989 RepID=UPI001571E074|nr:MULTISPECIES: isoprenylcysteine carboxylmethyltransferase family protein [Paracoccaceae]MBJ2153449.1 isoprenylcysteine carboxylmethyltransferase family protein [Paracoccus sp. IB05]NTT88419.1 isoprenylcysteine carboxylmethyltransferase family protein [Tabrizicola sp. SY72]
MPSLMGWASFAALSTYLVLFFIGTLRLAQHGQRVWLFTETSGPDRLAALGFRAAFALAFLGPLLWQSIPWLHKSDPLWSEYGILIPGLAGAAAAWIGAFIALSSQSDMGTSWRVGTAAGQSSSLVTTGLFSLSRNPTFLGQASLLIGIALALPGLATAIAPVIFLWAAKTQISSEETLLLATHGEDYARYMRHVPRWIGRKSGAA